MVFKIILRKVTRKRITHFIQLVLFAILVHALYIRAVNIVLNAIYTLFLTLLPSILTKKFDIPSDPGIMFLITLAVGSHAAGFMGYYDVWW